VKNLERVRAAAPDAMLGYLYPSGLWVGWRRTWVAGAFCRKRRIPYATMVTRNYIERQHALNRRVHVWTVNDREQMGNLFSWGWTEFSPMTRRWHFKREANH
jgi:glycerophosphoryl diester phosphodiesterase